MVAMATRGMKLGESLGESGDSGRRESVDNEDRTGDFGYPRDSDDSCHGAGQGLNTVTGGAMTVGNCAGSDMGVTILRLSGAFPQGYSASQDIFGS